MPCSAIFVHNYLRLSLNPLRTSSFQLRRRLTLSPRLVRPLPPLSSPALVLTCSSSSHVSSSNLVIKKTGNRDSYSSPYFYQQSLPYSRYAYDEYASEEESDREHLQSSPSLGASTLDNIEEWKWKLTTLIRNKNEQELVSRERKDRRDFEQISALATRMGLHSRQYAKVVVFSKVPLPNYRSDLDDKRPQREVVLSPELHSRVDYHLKSYLSQKSVLGDGYPNNVLPTSSTSSSLVIEEGLHEQNEPLRRSPVAEGILRRKSLQLRNIQQDWKESAEGQKMQELRRSLPAYKEKEALLNAISRNQVIVVSGETGCGKTTQLPQYILESEIDAARGALCSIICTQPRRISAMSVAERVAAERGEKLGDSVGYKVRLEGIKGRDTRLLFCTTGILLRRLLLDRSLRGVTHVIVDEIHERGMNEGAPSSPARTEGFTYPVRSYFLENILEMTGYRLSTYNQIDNYGQEKSWKMQKQTVRKRKSQIASAAEDALEAADLRDFNPRTRDSLSCWNADSIGFNLIENVLCHICRKERPGAVLVFMTGWDDINSLKDQLQSHPLLGDPTKVLLLACHGSMDSSEQKLIFNRPEDGIRKIVLATNMAETSITINDVVFVVDCGKAKETSYDALNNTPCLLPAWISKASARQRRGRAGRVQPGECYHLYPKSVYDAFAEYQLPELLRTPLQSLCLQIKSLQLGSISEFLSRALQPPEPLSVQNAIEYLKIIGALDDNENLTVLGRKLSVLPVEPKLGKMLILGAIFNCLDPIMTIVAGLSVRDPFLMPFDKKDLAESAKAQFSSRDNSDHLALLRAFDGWKAAERQQSGHEYCWRNFLSSQTLRAIDSLRKQFYHLLRDGGLNKEKSVSLKTMEDGPVLLYSNSVNSQEPTIPYPWLVFNEKVKVNSVFLRDSTAVSDSVLLLFGGNVSRGGLDGHLKMLGGYLEFFMKPGLAGTYLALKRELNELIHMKLLNPKKDIGNDNGLLEALKLLVSGDRCEGRFVYGRKLPPASKSSGKEADKKRASTSGSVAEHDNSKNHLQTLLLRAGHQPPTYKTSQLKNNKFRSTVFFNGLDFVGQPCGGKKLAEKSAASEALQWLTGETQSSQRAIDHISTILKKSKTRNRAHTTRGS
ncbi:protein of unknown function DUF1605 [Cynara cardunculus var. scolymus]|uniref:RNA helicase n=1 Tax=Cynara cardunculus var. scolymus TaxID=59895 RepID=A0A103Y8E2_CYNCS|nr:protein of unknown function DUF1605 [Cynara cardunculus var. scolymus]